MGSRSGTSTPIVGDHVKLRGREPEGVLVKVNDLQWARVSWERGKEGPMLVHLKELEKVTETPVPP